MSSSFFSVLASGAALQPENEVAGEQSPIQNRRRRQFVSEDDPPFGDMLVRRDQQAVLIVSGVDHLEERVRRPLLERQVTRFVDDLHPRLTVLGELVI